MVAQPLNHQEPAQDSSPRSLIDQARSLSRKLSWLSPANSLVRYAGKEFGRNIRSSITDLAKNQEAGLISLHNQQAAVVMTVDQYEDLFLLKNLCLELLEEVKEKEIADAGDEFDQLFRQISSPESRKAADLLFTASPEAFANAYKPGETEQN